MTENIIIALIAFAGTLAGSYFAQKKSTALVVYRLEQLENKVDKHNSAIERTYKLEQNFCLMDEKIRVANHRLDDLERKE
jgi:tetrahydromethanopterin S-methyltransferase subunit G